MAETDGGPAFPRPAGPRGPYGAGSNSQGGMSLRDWFAGQALTGLIAAEEEGGTYHKAQATMAYALADAMLKERGKSNG